MSDRRPIAETQYLRFERHDIRGRATPIVYVLALSSGDTLGEIRWYGAWRQFCFYPARETLFNVGCMDDIKTVIEGLMRERGSA